MSKLKGNESAILLYIMVIAGIIFIGSNSMDFGSKQPGPKGADSKTVVTSPEVKIGGGFELTNQNGETVSDKDFADKKKIFFFGFTNCPHVCPTSMAVISAALADLSKEAKANIQPIFVTVDPARDTPEQIKTYLENFDPAFIGLTGDAETLKKVHKSYRIYAAKADDNENYDMMHSSVIYIMDEQNEYLAHFSMNDSSEKIAAYLENL